MSARRSKRIKSEEGVKVERDIEQEEEENASDDHLLDNYEQIRQDNIHRNQQFLNSIGIQDVKSDLHLLTSTTSSAKPSSRGLSTGAKRKTPASRSTVPPRRSGRVTIERLKKEIDDTIASGNADVTLLDQKRGELEIMVAEKAATTYDASANASWEENSETRHSPDDITLLTPLNQPKHADEAQPVDWGHGLLPLLREDSQNITTSAVTTASQKKDTISAYRASMASLQVVETDVAKVVPQRITALVIHPSRSRSLVIAGDKQGIIVLSYLYPHCHALFICCDTAAVFISVTHSFTT